MAINSTYYLDAADLATATAVYLDLLLVNIAPDGFYGDGIITREQSSGILLAEENCPSCEGSLLPSYRSDPGVPTYLISLCESLIPDVPFFIYGNTCVVQNGDIACNTNNIIDTFNGLDEYYKVYFAICPDTYICQISPVGVITVIGTACIEPL